MSEALRSRIRSPGPKRILSLDGGGIRGLITLGFLEHIEERLKARLSTVKAYTPSPTPNYFRLRDYYDLIGGTSTGAIIAAGLAIGMKASEITETYLRLGREIFARPDFWGNLSGGLIVPKFDSKPLADILSSSSLLGHRTVGDDSITTGLCIIAKRFDANSVWPIVNAPDSKYYDRAGHPNKDFQLSQIVRASTAAPTYFEPEHIILGDASFGFIDGGISMHNNPALQLFMVATLPGFGFEWETGPENLSIVSVGTGDWNRRVSAEAWNASTMPATEISNIVDMLMADASTLNETMLQAIGMGTHRREIDRVVGHLNGKQWGQSLLRYERFQVMLEDNFFDANGLSAYKRNIGDYRRMDNVERMHELLEIGRTLAASGHLAETLP